MGYKALKPCQFAGVQYLIGDIIPDGIVHTTASVRLLRDGVIEAVDAGATPPPSPTLEPEEKMPEAPEEVIEPADEPEEEAEVEIDGEAGKLTVDSLVGLKKKELLELAEDSGLDVSKLKNLKKPDIAQAVFEVIGDDV